MFEVNNTQPFVHFLYEFKGAETQTGIQMLPLRLIDAYNNEVARFIKLRGDNVVEHVSFSVPRKVFKQFVYFNIVIRVLYLTEYISVPNRFFMKISTPKFLLDNPHLPVWNGSAEKMLHQSVQA